MEMLEDSKVVITSWEKIESWSHASELLISGSLRCSDTFCSPATEVEINQLKNEFGIKLPESFIVSLKRHNGGMDLGTSLPFLHMHLNNCQEIIDHRRNIAHPPLAIGPNSIFQNLYPAINDPLLCRLKWEATQRKVWEQSKGKILKSGGYYLLDEEMECIHVGSGIKPCLWNLKWVNIASNEIVVWYIDLDPGKYGMHGQIIEIDIESGIYTVIANSYSQLISKYVDAIINNDFSVFDFL